MSDLCNAVYDELEMRTQTSFIPNCARKTFKNVKLDDDKNKLNYE
jgi:hypothetical protein